jgi:hypothetical protein
MGKVTFPLAGAMEKVIMCTLTALSLIAWPARASLMTRHVPACCLSLNNDTMKHSTAQHSTSAHSNQSQVGGLGKRGNVTCNALLLSDDRGCR